MKYIKFGLLPLLLLVSLYVLFFQPGILGISIVENGEFPLGTLISWLIVFLFSLFFYLIISVESKNIFGRISNVLLVFNVLIGAFWGLFSFLLAGNWNFVFNDNLAFYTWIGCTLLVFFIPLMVALVLGFWRLKNRFFS